MMQFLVFLFPEWPVEIIEEKSMKIKLVSIGTGSDPGTEAEAGWPRVEVGLQVGSVGRSKEHFAQAPSWPKPFGHSCL